MPEAPFFNVAQLLKEPIGATRNGRVDVLIAELVPELQERNATGHLSGQVRLMHTIDGVLVQGDARAEVALDCVRCLDPVSVALEIAVEETFVPTLDILSGQIIQPEEEDRALWIDEHHILDLSEVLRQDVLVALPLHVVCRPDCLGLCSTCGKNLNDGPCDCLVDSDPRWTALRDLLDRAGA
jgi:uncharacterized protein